MIIICSFRGKPHCLSELDIWIWILALLLASWDFGDLIDFSGLQFPLLCKEDDDMVSVGLLRCLDPIMWNMQPSAGDRTDAYLPVASPLQQKAEVSVQAYH